MSVVISGGDGAGKTQGKRYRELWYRYRP